MGSYDNSYTCPECGHGFSDPGGWQLPRLVWEHNEKHHPPQPGPVEKVKKWTTCTGCPALYTDYWKLWDHDDSGTSAICLLKEDHVEWQEDGKLKIYDGPKSITAYWHDNDNTPDWCPAK